MAGSSSITSTLPLDVVSTSRETTSNGIHDFPCRYFHRFHLRPRQFQVESRAARAPVRHLDRPAMLLYDPVGHRQPQAGTLARALGSEEGIVNLVQVFGGDAAAGIDY